MRVISGTAKSIPLKTLKGINTRPTTDRIKETLFNMIGNDIYNKSILDLFCGSASIGIEALSRGANRGVFVDNNCLLKTIIEFNLKKTNLYDRSEIVIKDVFLALDYLKGKTFDYIFIDPPYGRIDLVSILNKICKNNLASCDTIIIIEEDINFDCLVFKNTLFNVNRLKNYKTNKHIFLKKGKN